MNIAIIFLSLFFLVGCERGATPTIAAANESNNPNKTWRSEGPLTYAAAVNGQCPIQLPQMASNIQYVNYYGGYGGVSIYVAFDAPVDVCRAHAEMLLEKYNKSASADSTRLPIEPGVIPEFLCDTLTRKARQGEVESQALWFDPDQISDGEMWGEYGDHKPVMLIDTSRGRFYYHMSD